MQPTMLCTTLSILGSHEVREVQCLENAIEEVQVVYHA